MKKTIFSKHMLLLVLFGLAGFASAAPNWQLVTPAFEQNDAIVAGYVVSPSSFSNQNDVSDEVQSMLNDLNNCGGDIEDQGHGGGVLYFKSGHYKFRKQINVPKGVTIRGDWQKPVKGQSLDKGAVFEVYWGANKTGQNDAFIKLHSGASVQGITFWYPEQTNYANPTPYSHTILLGKGYGWSAEFNFVRNVTFVNAYSGIYYQDDGGTCPNVNGVYGTPMVRGVEIDNIVDIGRLDNLDFSPAYWEGSGFAGAPSGTNSTNFRNWLYNNGVGVIMRRNDWSYTCYLTVDGYNKGFWAAECKKTTDSATPNGHNYGFHFKNCKYGLYHDGRMGEGVMFTYVTIDNCAYGCYASDVTGGTLQLLGWKFNQSDNQFAIYVDPKSGAKINFQQSTINGGRVLVNGGSFAAADCDFNNAQPQVELAQNTRGVLLGNRWSKGRSVSEKNVFANTIDDTALGMKPLPAYTQFVDQAKKPTGTTLVVVNPGSTNRFNVGNDKTGDINNALQQVKNAGGGIVFLPPGHYRINGQIQIPEGVELKGSTDVGTFPLGPGSYLDVYNRDTPAVLMAKNSGLRGVHFDYPEQVRCTVIPNSVIDFPFTIKGNGDNIYIVNVGTRCSNRGVDLQGCNNFYINYLTGYFFREGVNIKNSNNGIVANMQCNTQVYNNGYETKYGQFPNSQSDGCPASTDPYTYNSKNLNFMTVEGASNLFLYNDFNYNTLNGLILKSNVSGHALGFALDDDRTGLLLDGNNIDFDFLNLQCVALDRDSNFPTRSTYITATGNYGANSNVTIYASDYWGNTTADGAIKMQNGAQGTLNLYACNIMQANSDNVFKVEGGTLNIINSTSASSRGDFINQSGSGKVNIIGSFANVSGNPTTNKYNAMGGTVSPTASISRNGWVASASYSGDGSNPSSAIDGKSNTRWTSGWQNQGTGQGEVWFQIDMQQAQKFNQVVLDYSAATTDGPQTYKLLVSNDGNNWSEVASGNGGSGMTVISFEQQNARYFRVVKPQSNKGSFWAIYEVYAFNTDAAETPVDPQPEDPGDTDDCENPTCDKVQMKFALGDYKYIADVNGEATAVATSSTATQWYAIPAGKNTYGNDVFYLKNVSTNKYLYADATNYGGGDWKYNKVLTSGTNAKTDMYKWIFFQNPSRGTGDLLVFCEAFYDGSATATAINGNCQMLGNFNQESEGLYPSVVAPKVYVGSSSDCANNAYNTITREVVESNVTNPDCSGTSGDEDNTKEMYNPLFVDFTSPLYEGAGEGRMYTADPSAHVFNGRLYVYASHDMEPAQGCDHMDRYHVFSTNDMKNWTDHGEIFGSKDVSWGRAEGGFMWAPDCAYNPANQTYYYYFPHPTGTDWGATWKIGVATSKYPDRDFQIQGYITGLESLIDPCVFVDDDGQPYIYHGGGGKCMGGKLNKNDWTKLDGTMTQMQGLNDFHEATWVHKYNGKYYLSYADNHGDDGNQLKYAVADSPLGPWTSMGVFLYATGCDTSHGSIVEYKGQWYAFYHTSNASGEYNLRSVCFDPLYYNADGSIQVVKNWGEPYNGTHTIATKNNTTDIALKLEAEDFNTGSHYGYWDKTTGNSTGAYRNDVNVDIATENGTTFVGNMEKGEWLRYTVNAQKAGNYDIDFYVASGNGNGKFHVSINGTKKSADISVPNTGGWTSFQKLTVTNIPLKAGEQYIDIRIDNGFNFDRMEIRNAQPYSGTPYNGPHNIQNNSVVEAEDFDNGGEGIAYHDNEPENKAGAYRTNEGVDIETSSGSTHLSWTNGGEWTKYTLNVTEAGTYDIDVRVSTGNNASGTLSLTIDDVYEYPSVGTTTASWDTYTTITVKGVELTAGTHYLTMTIGGNINVDKYTFKKVSSEIITITGVTISGTPASDVAVGTSVTLSATVQGTGGTIPQTVTWTSNNDNIKVNNGVVTATAAGTATITATSTADTNKSASCTIKFIVVNVPVTGVTINASSTTVLVNETVTLSAEISPSNATNKDVTFAVVSGPGSINGNILTATGTGEIVVKVTTADGNKTATMTITATDCNATGAADLVITDVDWAPRYVAQNDEVKFIITVKNQGGTALPVTTKIGVLIQMDGSEEYHENSNTYIWSDTYKNQNLPQTLEPCGTIILETNGGDSGKGTWKAGANGNHTVKATVDDSGLVAEKDENNNVFTKTLVVNGGQPTGWEDDMEESVEIIAVGNKVFIKGLQGGEKINTSSVIGVEEISFKAKANIESFELTPGVHFVRINNDKVTKVLIY